MEKLKNSIAKKTGQNVDELIFRRGGSHGAELVEDELGLKQANIYNMMSIYIENGEPTRQGWKKLKFFLVDYYNPDWHSTDLSREPHDHEFFTFTEL